MSFKPIGQNVLVKRDIEEDGLLWVPKHTKEIHSYGKIIALGEKVKNLKLGQVILFDDHHTRKIATKGYEKTIGDFLLIKEKDVFAVVEQNPL